MLKNVINTIKKVLNPQMEAGESFGLNPRSQAGSAEDYNIGPSTGVRVDTTRLTGGAGGDAAITIGYTGMLTTSGADTVFVHCGMGPGRWEGVTDIPMKLGQSGEWVAEVNGMQGETFDFCFHDGAGNWDNNYGNNWSVTVEKPSP